MRIKVSDYIAEFCVKKQMIQVFTVVGGGAMHMNDSFGHHPAISCVYNHHEQACAMAAEGYARLTGTPAVVCVTSGPGALNALNGVAGAYQDSIPMFVLSGQCKSALMARNTGLKLRSMGNQEFDIVPTLSNMTKYAVTVLDAGRIRFELEKAYMEATAGRPGPCWLDIPLDIQGSYVETEELEGFPAAEKEGARQDTEQLFEKIVEHLKLAQRPVIYAGNGIRLAGAHEDFLHLVDLLQIPVVTCWDSIDLIATAHPCYCGRGGTMGDRAGNFAVQNSDLLICIGTRLNIYQVGYNVKTWARAAYTVVVDIDPEELKKPIMRADLPVCMDAGEFIRKLDKMIRQENLIEDNREPGGSVTGRYKLWLEQCNSWKKRYPVVSGKHYQKTGKVNAYAFIDRLSHMAGDGSVTVVANGSASVVGSAAYYIDKHSRFVMNCGISSMGYGLPAAIGASVAVCNTCREDTDRGRKPVICIEGDGSVMMNLQELQTMATNRLPLKLFVLNNNGYHQIRQTQNNIFHNGLVGVGPDSDDLGFPDFKKIAEAFGIAYFCIAAGEDLDDGISHVLAQTQGVLCEVLISTEQVFEPKSATRRLEDGTLVSPPLEDMAPFLPREELKENMYIPLVEES